MKPICRPIRGIAPDGRVIVITPRRQARSLILRLKANELHLTVPFGYSAGLLADRLPELVERFNSRFQAPAGPRYSIGQIISCPDLEIEIYQQSAHPGHVVIGQGIPRSRLGVGSNIDLSEPSAQAFLSSAICKLAYRVAPQLLLPLAEKLCGRVGVHPVQWRIGRGLRTLGTCSATRIVTLSCALVFLPTELREYVICHELAHLSEMNHSPRFHALCNAYLQGKEKPLIAALKRYEWPIIR